jgi:hypothetical protein
MSAEFPKNEVAPVESKDDKVARLRAELAALEAPEESQAAPEAQAETPADAAQEHIVETAAASDPAAAERASADAAALAATRERLGMVAESGQEKQRTTLDRLREERYADVTLSAEDLKNPEVWEAVKGKELDQARELLSSSANNASTLSGYDTWTSFGKFVPGIGIIDKQLLADPSFAEGLQSICAANNATIEQEEGDDHWAIHFHGAKGQASTTVNGVPTAKYKVGRVWPSSN